MHNLLRPSFALSALIRNVICLMGTPPDFRHRQTSSFPHLNLTNPDQILMFGYYKYHTSFLIKSGEGERREQTCPAWEPKVLRNDFSKEWSDRWDGRGL